MPLAEDEELPQSLPFYCLDESLASAVQIWRSLRQRISFQGWNFCRLSTQGALTAFATRGYVVERLRRKRLELCAA